MPNLKQFGKGVYKNIPLNNFRSHKNVLPQAPQILRTILKISIEFLQLSLKYFTPNKYSNGNVNN